MTTPTRGLIASMLRIGGAQSISIVISLVRMKLLSLMLGPAGVGLLGIYSGLQTTVAQFASLGTEQSGVRDIASAGGDAKSLARVRIALLAGNMILGSIAMVLVWLFRAPLASLLMEDHSHSTEVGLVGIAVLAGMLASSQLALLQGMQRIGDLARVTLLGSIAGTVAGLLAVWWLGEAGLILFLLVQPLTSAIVAYHYCRKLPRSRDARSTLADYFAAWLPMARLGAVFMLAGLASSATLLFVRGLIARDLGLEAAGLFGASWGITITYVGFLLNAMSADYFPRLTAAMADRPASIRLINDQIQLGLAIGGPILLLLIGLAPWLMNLLYARAFVSAAEILQWQTAGNVFKLASWPLGFAIVAAAQSRLYLGVELCWNLVFVALIWLCLPTAGLRITGIAFLIAYVVYFVVLLISVRRMMQFRMEGMTLGLILGHAAAALLILGIALFMPLAGAAIALVLAAGTGLIGIRLIATKVGLGDRYAGRVMRLFAAVGWPIG